MKYFNSMFLKTIAVFSFAGVTEAAEWVKFDRAVPTNLVEENSDRTDFLHELQVHVEVLYEMTERMRQEMEKPEFELLET